jgi:preprotein translocase subunit YajC
VLAELWSWGWILAEAANNTAPKAGDQTGNPLGGIIIPFVFIAILFYFMMWRPEKRKQAEHQSLLSAIKKNDRVVTIGGIYGVVSNVQREADRVTLKVDETNNTKIDVTFGAISRVIVEQAESDKKA